MPGFQTLVASEFDPQPPPFQVSNADLGYPPQGLAPAPPISEQAGGLTAADYDIARGFRPSRSTAGLARDENGKVIQPLDDYDIRGILNSGAGPDKIAAILAAHQVPMDKVAGLIQARKTVGEFQTLSEDTALKRTEAKANLARKMADVYPNPEAAARAEGVNLPGFSAGFGAPVNGVPGVRAQAQSDIPSMPPEIASSPRRVQQQWLLQQTRPSIAGVGAFTPATLEFTAKQYLAGDRQAAQGFARSATARIALQNAIVEEATKQGLGPREVAAQMADFAGIVAGSRTTGQRAANIALAATEAEEMLGIVKEQSMQFPRGNFVPWNMALRAYESGTGSPEIAAFGASVNALVNVYARAINPTGVPTVSDKEHARAVLNTVQSQEQVDAVLGIIRRELEIAKRAPATVRKATTRSITGSSPSTTNGGASVSNW